MSSDFRPLLPEVGAFIYLISGYPTAAMSVPTLEKFAVPGIIRFIDFYLRPHTLYELREELKLNARHVARRERDG